MKEGPLAGLGLSSFSSFCKKWTDQREVCGLEKKKEKVTVRVGHISGKEKAPTKNTHLFQYVPHLPLCDVFKCISLCPPFLLKGT